MIRGELPPRLAFAAALEQRAETPRLGMKIGEGASGAVYALDDRTVVKLTPRDRASVHAVETREGELRYFIKRFQARRFAESIGTRPLLLRLVASRHKLAADEFMTDVLACYALESLALPLFVRQLDAYYTPKHCVQHFERARCTLRHLAPRIELEELKAICLMIVYAVHEMQRVRRMLHHDLHLQNVLVVPMSRSYLYWKGTYRLRSRFMPKISDFSYASFVYKDCEVERAELCAFEENQIWNEDEDEWGPWRPGLAGQRGYDLQTLFCSLTLLARDKEQPEKEAWAQRVLDALHADGSACYPSGRPRWGRVSDVAPERLLPLFEDLFVSSERSHSLPYVNGSHE